MLLYEGLKETGDFLDWGHEGQQGHLIETVNFHYLTFFSNMQRNKESVGCFIRDGPFDIHGGWGVLGFFLATSYFFLSFCTTSYFFQKYTATSFFYFLEKITQNQKIVNGSNTLNEKTLNFFLIISCQQNMLCSSYSYGSF